MPLLQLIFSDFGLVQFNQTHRYRNEQSKRKELQIQKVTFKFCLRLEISYVLIKVLLYQQFFNMTALQAVGEATVGGVICI